MIAEGAIQVAPEAPEPIFSDHSSTPTAHGLQKQETGLPAFLSIGGHSRRPFTESFRGTTCEEVEVHRPHTVRPLAGLERPDPVEEPLSRRSVASTDAVVKVCVEGVEPMGRETLCVVDGLLSMEALGERIRKAGRRATAFYGEPDRRGQRRVVAAISAPPGGHQGDGSEGE